MNTYISHARQDPDHHWTTHKLTDHLAKVAQRAKTFAGERGAIFVEYAALLHDFGKFQPEFQQYIRLVTGYNEEAHIEDIERDKPNKIPHSTAGAKYAVENFHAFFGHLIAYLIAGHHAGLPDWFDKGSLKHRLQNADKEFQQANLGLKESAFSYDGFQFSDQKLQENLPHFILQNAPAELHIWIRYLFSCLVDADFLDTEAFMLGYANADEAKQHGVRPTFPTLAELHQRYTAFMSDLAEKADSTSTLNQERKTILQQCVRAAELDKSLFSLTVPTGGGKTLASLGFALKHALKFNKKRIIYAIPFTCIIEQNASVFRKVLGEESVLEHHSNLEIDDNKETARTRVATENWDAPLIVTTNVQLFESLFAAKTSRCRKIHNIADSVIILDEAQQIPRDFQKPITDMMRVLAKDYGVTFVLCTATQPKLDKEVNIFGQLMLEGLPDVYEIIDDPTGLAERLQRTQIHFPDKNAPRQSWQEIADEIAQNDCVLAVVNTRKHAQTLFQQLPNHAFKLHLSTNMCAEHRVDVINQIRDYLKQYQNGTLDKPLWVVSTQLIEAGVDLDFPVVYRAMAGLDSIVQAAGRCNREGKLPNGQLGQVIVFSPTDSAPTGSLKQGQDITEEMLSADLLDKPTSPQAFREYFGRFNNKGKRDKQNITECLTAEMSPENPISLQFRTAAERFHLIENQGIELIVPYVKSDQAGDYAESNDLPEPFETWFRLLESDPLKNKWVYKKLQRYTITIYENELGKLPKNAVFSRAGLCVLESAYYDNKQLGFNLGDRLLPPENSIF